MQSRRGMFTIALLALGVSLNFAASAESIVQTGEVLTNRAIVTLAAAGFNEDFLIELILNSKTHFDTSVDGLAGLAKQGVSERIMRVMLTTPAAGSAQISTVRPVETGARALPSAGSGAKKPELAELALYTRTPYDISTSFFWGFSTKHISLGVSQAGQAVLAPHLGTVYGAALSTGPVVAIAH